jgi:hypothetical protein
LPVLCLCRKWEHKCTYLTEIGNKVTLARVSKSRAWNLNVGLPGLLRAGNISSFWAVPRLVKERWGATTFGFGFQRAPVPTARIVAPCLGALVMRCAGDYMEREKGWLQHEPD